MVKPEYTELERVLMAALSQAQDGKGAERHARPGERFEDQQIVKVGEWLGNTGFQVGQGVKKAIESTRLPTAERRIKELLGAINFLAAAVLIEERKAGEKLAGPVASAPSYAGTLNADKPGSKPWSSARGQVQSPAPLPLRCKAVGPFGEQCISSEHAADVMHEDAHDRHWQTYVKSDMPATELCHDCLTARDAARREKKIGFLACSRCVDAAIEHDKRPKCQHCHVEDAIDHPMAVAGYCGYACADMAAAQKLMRRCVPLMSHTTIEQVGSLRRTIVDEVLDSLKDAPDFEPRRNGGVICDNDDGPCACGAWHKPTDFEPNTGAPR